MPGGKAQGPTDYQKPYRSWVEEEVSLDTEMDGQQKTSLLLT